MTSKNSPQHGLRQKAQIMAPSEIERTLVRLVHEIIEKNDGAKDLGLVGIRRRGVYLAQRIGQMIARIEKTPVPAVEPPRILVVESDESTRYFVTRVLSSEGIEVVDAIDLKEARAALAGSSVDLLLTARALPDGDGEGLAREARELHRARRVVLVAGEPATDRAGETSKDLDPRGIDAVLAKPLRVENLLDTVLGLLHDGHHRNL